MRTSRSRWPAVLVLAAMLLVAACSKGSETKGSGPPTLLDATSVVRSGAPVPSAGCSAVNGGSSATTSAPASTADHTDTAVTAGGLTGHVWQHLPPSYTGTTPVPLVIDLHGLTETYSIQPSMSGFPAVADANGFAYIAPGIDADIPWWDAEPKPTARDDMAFLKDVIAQEESQLCLDTSRIYVAGMSNGALMASAVGCALADQITAIAPVAGLRFPPDCQPSHPMPVIAFHGTADEYIDFETGGAGPKVAGLAKPPEFDGIIANARPVPIEEAAQKWAAADGCSTTPATTAVASDVKLIRYDGCSNGVAVELYVVDGGGHAWPGSTFSAQIESVVGHTTMNVVASEEMWKFFSQYQLPSS